MCTTHSFGGLTFGGSKNNKQTLLCNNCDGGNCKPATLLSALPGIYTALSRMGILALCKAPG
jgi:hypothetical protein